MIASRAHTSFIWSISERVASQGILFVISVILARLLTPQEYGVVATLLIFVSLVDVLVTNGLGEALIQKTDADKRDFDSIFVCGVVGSALLYFALFVASPAIADFFSDPGLCVLLRVLALRIPLSSLNAIQRSYMQKNYLFRELFFASAIGSLLAGVVSIVLAYYGWGVYSLIVQQLLSVLLTTASSSILAKWHPGLGFSWHSVRTVLPLGLQFAGSNFINVLYTEGRSLAIGKFYSAADLAFYNQGNRFPSTVNSLITGPVSNVMLPVMAELKDSMNEFRKAVRESIVVSAYLMLSLMAGLAACSDNFVLLLLTDKWSECIVYVQIFCLLYAFQPVQAMNWQALKALGQGDICIKLEIAKKTVGFSLLLLSIPFGVLAIACSSALFVIISTLMGMYPNGKLFNYSTVSQIKDLIPSIVFSLGIFIAMRLPMLFNAPLALQLVLQLIIGIAVFFGGSKLFKLEAAELTRGFMKAFLNKGIR